MLLNQEGRYKVKQKLPGRVDFQHIGTNRGKKCNEWAQSRLKHTSWPLMVTNSHKYFAELQINKLSTQSFKESPQRNQTSCIQEELEIFCASRDCWVICYCSILYVCFCCFVFCFLLGVSVLSLYIFQKYFRLSESAHCSMILGVMVVIMVVCIF